MRQIGNAMAVSVFCAGYIVFLLWATGVIN